VRDSSVTEDAVAAAADRFDGVQILVNNAGVGAFANVEDASDGE
jgi:NAD(P)-dependent dehydrogenase (short-subunit alcohol dehydrogenase family)